MPTPQPVRSPAMPPPLFVSRVPIVDGRQRALGYEIQWRGGAVHTDQGSRHEASTLVRALHGAGLRQGQKGFVPVSKELLIEGVPALLPADRVVLQIGPELTGDAEVRRACEELRRGNYAIALDGVEVDEDASDLLPFASYVKLDPASVSGDPRRRARTVSCLSRGITGLIATGIETFEQLETAAAEGFTAFQGFFLGRPTLLPSRGVNAPQLQMLGVLRALNDPNASIAQLEEVVRRDTGLCYRILRTVNSAAFARHSTVHSIRDALLLCGRDRVRRWASLYVLKGLNTDAHAEVMARSVVRARCCEALAAAHGPEAAGEAFLLGMCSLLDAVLQCPMSAVVAELPLDDATKQALCGASNQRRQVLDCVIAYERGAWEECETTAQAARLDAAVLPSAFVDALKWFGEIDD
jgi:EAL and modified HD-GYP domain-containing signal transduction protein